MLTNSVLSFVCWNLNIGIGLCLECSSCGPGGKGTCFGADMCCESSFGCYFKTAETNTCLFKNLTSPRPCNEKFWRIHLKATPCSLNGENLDGICVADRLCCSLGNNSKKIWRFFHQLSSATITGQCKTDLACDSELSRNQVDELPMSPEFYLPAITVL